MEQIPAIGKIVHYQRYGSPGGEHKSEPSPAVIVEVLPNDVCKLFVINPNGLYFNQCPYSKDPRPGSWSWPPQA